MTLHRVLIVLASVLIVSTAAAQRNQLKVGSDAPELSVKKWAKGDAVGSFQEGNVYIVEFWATWCGPCRALMPHLTELQTTFEPDGLTIIGVSSEEEETVTKFVSGQGDRMGYTVAVDNNKATERAWMQAANQDGYPTAFIVDQRGKIQFIGHPGSNEFHRVLVLVLGGRYDARLYAESRPMLNAAENARKMRNWRQAFTLFDKVIEVDNHIFAPLEIEKFDMMMVDMADPDAAYRHARTIMSTYADDPNLLVDLAEKIATDSDIPSDARDLDLAMELINVAERRIRRDDPNMLAAKALVHYHRGELNEAASLQRRAWMVAVPQRKAGFERVMRNYQTAAAADSDRSTSRGGTSFRR